MKIAVILPAYNEEKTIKKAILDFAKQLPKANIVVVDNASTDNTATIAKSVLSKLKVKGQYLFEPRKGKSMAIKKAFTEINADYYILCDADDTYPAKDVQSLLDPLIANEADITIGNRHHNNNYANSINRKFHGIGNLLVIFLIKIIYGSKVSDVLSGYRGLSNKFVKLYPILNKGFEVEAEMTLHALDKKYRIVNVSIDYKARPEGSFSKLNTYFDGARILFSIAQIFRYLRPLYFYFILSMAFSFAGIIAAIPVFYDWILYKFIYRLPLAVLASSLEIVAVLLFGIGVILDSISYYQRYNYEIQKINFNDRITKI